MTKEEVIKFLKIIRNALSNFKEYGHDKASMVIDCDKVEAIDMAIEALSEPINCVKCKHYYETEDDTDVHGHCRMDTAHTDLISRADAIDAICDEWCYVTYGNCPHCDDGFKCDGCDDVKRLESLPSAEAVTIHEDGTLEVEVPNAHKVGRVLVMDTESHIGGGLFYPDDAVQGEWRKISPARIYECSICNHNVLTDYIDTYNYCPSCGTRMKGGAE